MRDPSVVLGVLAAAAALWAVVAAMRIGAWLSAQGVTINWIWYRATMPWYVHRYRAMTVERDGRPGPLYWQFVVPINVALVLAVAAIVTGLAR